MLFHKAVSCVWFVVAGGLFVEFCAVQDSAAFGVGCAEYNAFYSCEGEGCYAHGAGLQCDVQSVFWDALRLCFVAGFAYGQHFCVSGWVVYCACAVAGAGDDILVFVAEYCADGHFVMEGGFFCLFHCDAHKAMVLFCERVVHE